MRRSAGPAWAAADRLSGGGARREGRRSAKPAAEQIAKARDAALFAGTRSILGYGRAPQNCICTNTRSHLIEVCMFPLLLTSSPCDADAFAARRTQISISVPGGPSNNSATYGAGALQAGPTKSESQCARTRPRGAG